MYALALSWTPSISTKKPFLIKGLLWRWRGGGRESLKSDWKKQGEGRSQTYLYARSKKNITWFFKQQIEFFVISYLVVAESFIRRCRHFFKIYLFICTCKYFCCCYRIYICVRNIAIFYSEFTKERFFSLFHSSIFH